MENQAGVAFTGLCILGILLWQVFFFNLVRLLCWRILKVVPLLISFQDLCYRLLEMDQNQVCYYLFMIGAHCFSRGSSIFTLLIISDRILFHLWYLHISIQLTLCWHYLECAITHPNLSDPFFLFFFFSFSFFF